MRHFYLPLFAMLLLLAAPLRALGRVPPPDAVSQAKARTLVLEIYGKEIDRAKTAEELTQLANKLVDAAGGANDDSPDRYVLLRMAGNLAVRAGDSNLALRVVNEMARSFEIDVLAVRVNTLRGIAAKRLTPKQTTDLLSLVVPLIEETAEHERYDLAKEMLRVASAAAKRTKNYQLINELGQRQPEIDAAAKAFSEISDAMAALEKNPVDPHANTTVGRYRCFEKGQWKLGIPMLALGNDQQLKKAAIAELAAPKGATERIALADLWWSLAEAAKDRRDRDALRSRAVYWYELALADLGRGLLRTKAEARIQSAKDDPEKPKPKTPGKLTSTQLKYSLAFGGSQHVRLGLGYHGAKPLTIEAVVSPSRVFRVNNQAIVGTYASGGIALMQDGNRWGMLVSAPSIHWAHSKQPVHLHRFVHLAGVYDGKSVWLFVDGVFQARTETRGTFDPSGQPLGIGGFAHRNTVAASECFAGQIAAVRISTGALYTKDFQPEYPFKVTKETVALYQLEKGKGQRARDSSRNENHGLIIGAKWIKLDPKLSGP